MIRVLVIDDEPQIVRALRVNLRARGYEVDAAPDATTGLTLAAKRPPDIVILDLGLPDMDGGEVIAGLRGWSTAPIIVLTGRTDLPQKIAALDAGADDYVTKPFDIEELFARMRAVARRAPATGEPAVEIGSWIVDLASHRIRPRDGVGPDHRLTPTEWRILEILVRHPGRLVTQRHLLAEVWGPAYQKETNYLRLYLAQLRRKLEPDPRHPRHLLTDPGMGYRYVPAADRVPGQAG
ncbi:MAG TPA: response regulator [Mycobacteriales bacterium]|nr:response regulator [Mycobacteriales bacterium]